MNDRREMMLDCDIEFINNIHDVLDLMYTVNSFPQMLK